MKKLDYFFLFLIAAAPFIVYMFNPVLVGADTYFYVNQVCGISDFVPTDFLFDFVLQAFSCNIIQIKIYLMLLWFGCLVAMAKIGELYDKERGVEAAFVMAGLTLFVLSFFAFENDTLGFTLFFWALYFLLSYDKTGRKKHLILCIILTIIGGLVWKGIVYWVIIYPIFSFLFIPAAIFILAFMPDFWFFLNANRNIAEHAMWISIIYWGLTVLFLFGIMKTSKKITLAFIILCIPAIFVAKLYILCIPFVSLIAFNGIKALKMDKTTVYSSLLMIALMAGCFWGLQTFNNFPTADDTIAIQAAIGLDPEIQNIFGPGYYIKYLGGHPSSSGALAEDNYVCEGVVIERTFFEDCNCPIFLEKGTILVKNCPFEQ